MIHVAVLQMVLLGVKCDTCCSTTDGALGSKV